VIGLSQSDIIGILRHRIAAEGGQVAWAKRHGINQAYVSLALAGKIGVGPRIAKAVGYDKKVVFVACNANPDGA
jgi:hypothetical protein